MASVATTAASYTCPHSGIVTVTAASSILTVSGIDVVLSTDVVGSTITSCTWTGGSNIPCTAVVSYISGNSIFLQKGGVFVLLDGATFATNGNGGSPPILSVSESQTKLTAT